METNRKVLFDLQYIVDVSLYIVNKLEVSIVNNNNKEIVMNIDIVEELSYDVF